MACCHELPKTPGKEALLRIELAKQKYLWNHLMLQIPGIGFKRPPGVIYMIVGEGEQADHSSVPHIMRIDQHE